jgi:hypothetical protein
MGFKSTPGSFTKQAAWFSKGLDFRSLGFLPENPARKRGTGWKPPQVSLIPSRYAHRPGNLGYT